MSKTNDSIILPIVLLYISYTHAHAHMHKSLPASGHDVVWSIGCTGFSKVLGSNPACNLSGVQDRCPGNKPVLGERSTSQSNGTAMCYHCCKCCAIRAHDSCYHSHPIDQGLGSMGLTLNPPYFHHVDDGNSWQLIVLCTTSQPWQHTALLSLQQVYISIGWGALFRYFGHGLSILQHFPTLHPSSRLLYVSQSLNGSSIAQHCAISEPANRSLRLGTDH